MPPTNPLREVLVLLRPDEKAQNDHTAGRHLDADELTRRSRATRSDGAIVRSFAARHQLTVVRVNLRQRTMILAGRATALRAAFRRGKIPRDLTDVVIGVFGSGTSPVAKRPRYKKFPPEESQIPPPVNADTRPPKDFRQLYHFPRNATGRGECIGVLEFGGGFSRAKLREYLRIQGIPNINLVVRSIAGAKNRPLSPTGMLTPDAEVYMDLQILAGLAPEAKLVVYFAENSSRGWIEALNAAIFDRKHRPSVLSISWGQAEQDWDPHTILAIEAILKMATTMGITVCCPSGDRGVFESGRAYTIPYPGSSPHVLSCGGTALDVLSSKRQRESVWNESPTAGVASGGGVSRLFDLPEFQNGHGVPGQGRGIPDVAANAAAATGYLICFDGITTSLGGTSASTPVWAALIACLNQALGRRVGYLTPFLYQHKRVLRSIVHGDNKLDGRQGYTARKGWDACTGLGSPHGVKLLTLLRKLSGPAT